MATKFIGWPAGFFGNTKFLGWNIAGVPPVTYDPDAEAYFNRLPDAIDDTLKGYVNDWIVSIKIWNGLPLTLGGLAIAFDYIYILGGMVTEANSKINVVSSFFTLAQGNVGTPMAWSSLGYTGATGTYLKTNYIDSVNASAYGLSDGFQQIYARTEGSNGAEFEIGSWSDNNTDLNTSVSARYSGNAIGNSNNVNNTTECLAAVASAIGLTTMERVGNTKNLWRNDSVIFTTITAPVGLVNYENYIGCINYVGSTPLRYTTKQISFAAKGKATRIDQVQFKAATQILGTNLGWWV